MKILRRVLLIAIPLLLVAVVAAYWWQRPLLLTGTGYAAHNACAVGEISARDDADRDLPPNPLVPYLRTSEGDGGTTASLLGVLARQQAWYADGFGCTLADERPDLGEPTDVTADGNPFADAATPTPSEDVAAAVGRAFGDGESAELREDLDTRAVVVVRDGQLVAERYADGFTADMPQLGWSMSKSATNLITGLLVQQGAVEVEEAGLREEWTDERADITVEDLLRMTSGLAWDETYDLGTPITRMLYLEEDMGGYVAGQEAAHEPGSYQQYSSGSTTLLCDVLAERTGQGADLPRRTLFSALGLSSALLEPDAVGTPVCSSYLWATPRDWAAMGQFALQDGRWQGEQLLPPSWMTWSTTVTPVDETEDDGYGAGWWVNQRPDGSLVHPTLPDDAYFAQGHDGQMVAVVPSEQLVVARLGFTPELEDDRTVSLVADLVAALE